MSSPSTPRSARSASRAADSPAMLTPGQKIKALMAQFDSDSESDTNTTETKPQTTKPSIFNRPQFVTQSDQENHDDDEDDEIIMPKGRMAARLQSENQTTEPVSAMERVSKSLRTEKEREDDAAGSSDDDLPTAGPRRRLADTKISEDRMDEDEARTPERERSFSPLFVSPGSERNGRQDDDGSDASDDERQQPKKNALFEALIAKKRAEREEKENQERQMKKERAEAAKLAAADEEDEDDDIEMDSTGGSSRAARPSRKASRKALEDMNRETQRMSRNLQLAHQATTSKKISKESFFARFNFMQSEQPKAPSADNSSSMAGSQNSSDEEAQKNRETPRTSPVVGPADKPSTEGASTEAVREETQFTSLEKMVGQAQQQPEQPVVGRVEAHTANPPPEAVDVKGKKKLMTAPSIHVRLSRQAVAQNQMDDSDSDLEVVTSPAKSRRLAAFENVPSKKMQESSALLKLKALAHLTSPTRKSTMNNAELSATLILQAKRQAAKERQEKIEELRAKGVIIETAAERAAMEDELENLVEKARKEAEDIAKQERSASKKGNGDMDDDDEEDEDYDGSEDEVDDNEDEDENENGEKGHDLFDSEAGEDDESADEQSETMSTGEPETTTQRRKRPTRIIEDDDEDEEQAPTTPARPINATPLSIERPQIPGLPSNDMTMSLTQVFAGTLGGSQQDSQPPSSTIPHSLPDPAQRGGEWQESDSQIMVKDSQEPQAETADFLARYTPSDARVSESPAPRAMSQFSSIPDPTQDEGFVLSPFDPSKRFMGTPTSTVETVLVDRNQSLSHSPVPNRKMKQLRRGRTELSAIEEQEESGFEVDASAFNVMKRAVKKPNVEFDRKKSKAKDVVEEAAEESEDEYAGLGGASDEEDEEENAYDRQMINDNSGETVDEKQLAALNAQHQRTTDEKQVAKLMRDITTGALRRRKGPDDEFDLDDSDDELLARRRQKQREFARMRNALMADGKVGELAENPKKAAFFRAIEDHDSDDDVLDFLDEEEAPGSQDYSSSQDANAAGQQDTTTDADNKRKRPLEPSAEDTYNRPPPHLRRKPASAISKKPASLAEIRETLSFLTEQPEYDSFQEDASMEDEQAHEDEAENAPVEEQSQEDLVPRVHPRRTKGPVVDRLALLRQASSNSATSASTRVAFHAGSGAQGPSIGFRPPPMLRKATTGSSSGSSKSDSRRMSAPAAGGAKKGAVNYYTAAREREREKELRTQSRAGGSNITKLLNKYSGNRLGSLGGTGQWD
ncbi:uncharacterized protein KD926_009487 [Aspergillus affinis]|uniref:uncharacterized protein n=1 Tax=Aspergillus affinis TaxID=1070780 RepID=UPI0022FE27D2|nr:uncharacterized protein KD926_009487 [Aspergillus affinis]KAI9039344.1 hypothetical protein KD926_009487 [Aspergillus affinis]